jgi:hypothetical protein
MGSAWMTAVTAAIISKKLRSATKFRIKGKLILSVAHILFNSSFEFSVSIRLERALVPPL